MHGVKRVSHSEYLFLGRDRRRPDYFAIEEIQLLSEAVGPAAIKLRRTEVGDTTPLRRHITRLPDSADLPTSPQGLAAPSPRVAGFVGDGVDGGVFMVSYSIVVEQSKGDPLQRLALVVYKSEDDWYWVDVRYTIPVWDDRLLRFNTGQFFRCDGFDSLLGLVGELRSDPKFLICDKQNQA